MRTTRRLVGATLIVATVLLPTHSARAEPTAFDASGIDSYVTAYMDRAGYPGVSVALTHGDDGLLTAGYGHDSTGAEMTAHTPMPVASVSKSFTALAVMQLVESGDVALNDPVQSYLPDFAVDDPRSSEITVRELLNQTSGISDRTLREKSLSQPISLQAAQERAHAATLEDTPGTRHHYTNTNYHLAARLVEVVSEQPFDDYLREHVLDPIGMDESTSIDRTPDDLPNEMPKPAHRRDGQSCSAPPIMRPHRTRRCHSSPPRVGSLPERRRMSPCATTSRRRLHCRMPSAACHPSWWSGTSIWVCAR